MIGLLHDRHLSPEISAISRDYCGFQSGLAEGQLGSEVAEWLAAACRKSLRQALNASTELLRRILI
jgi:hypothetical protein